MPAMSSFLCRCTRGEKQKMPFCSTRGRIKEPPRQGFLLLWELGILVEKERGRGVSLWPKADLGVNRAAQPKGREKPLGAFLVLDMT